MSTEEKMKALIDAVHNDAPTRYFFEQDSLACLEEYDITGHDADLLASRDQDYWHAMDGKHQPISNHCIICIAVVISNNNKIS